MGIPQSSIVDKLAKKHKKELARAQKEFVKPHQIKDDRFCADIFLFQKWAYRVGKGWYGFDLGDIPQIWVVVLDEFLSWLETQCPDFEIHQIKMKVGMVRIYLGTKTDLAIHDKKICSEIEKLQNLLRTPQNKHNAKCRP